MNVSSERRPNGWLHYTISGGYLVKVFYIGYSKNESLKLFKQYLKTGA